MNIEALFQKAVEHRDAHDCSAYPYQEGVKLIEYVQKFRPDNILEIGTGIGYTAAIMLLANPESQIITIEKDAEHAAQALEFLTVAKATLKNIEIISKPAEEFLPTLTTLFDFIFFDGYQIHYEFLPHYKRLLKPGGILFLANNHLKSRTSDKFFEELQNSGKWKIIEQFSDTTVAEKL